MTALKVLSVIFWGGVGILSAAVYVNQDSAVKPEVAVVRLYSLEGSFFCSGTVINDKYILTAAHCLYGAPAGKPIINVRSLNGIDQGITAELAGAQPRGDQGLIRGDFSQFAHKSVEQDQVTIMAWLLDDHRPKVTCGYPWGGKLVCTPVVNFRVGFIEGIFGVRGRGWMFPGMSGGPVVDVISGRIIGINTGADDASLFFGTTAGLAPNMRLKESDLE